MVLTREQADAAIGHILEQVLRQEANSELHQALKYNSITDPYLLSTMDESTVESLHYEDCDKNEQRVKSSYTQKIRSFIGFIVNEIETGISINEDYCIHITPERFDSYRIASIVTRTSSAPCITQSNIGSFIQSSHCIDEHKQSTNDGEHYNGELFNINVSDIDPNMHGPTAEHNISSDHAPHVSWDQWRHSPDDDKNNWEKQTPECKTIIHAPQPPPDPNPTQATSALSPQLHTLHEGSQPSENSKKFSIGVTSGCEDIANTANGKSPTGFKEDNGKTPTGFEKDGRIYTEVYDASAYNVAGSDVKTIACTPTKKWNTKGINNHRITDILIVTTDAAVAMIHQNAHTGKDKENGELHFPFIATSIQMNGEIHSTPSIAILQKYGENCCTHIDAITEHTKCIYVKFQHLPNYDGHEDMLVYSKAIDYLNNDAGNPNIWQVKQILAYQGPHFKDDYKSYNFNSRFGWGSSQIKSESLAMTVTYKHISCTIYKQEKELLQLSKWKQFRIALWFEYGSTIACNYNYFTKQNDTNKCNCRMDIVHIVEKDYIYGDNKFIIQPCLY